LPPIVADTSWTHAVVAIGCAVLPVAPRPKSRAVATASDATDVLALALVLAAFSDMLSAGLQIEDTESWMRSDFRILTETGRWAIQDSNLGPLPYQGTGHTGRNVLIASVCGDIRVESGRRIRPDTPRSGWVWAAEWGCCPNGGTYLPGGGLTAQTALAELLV